MKKLSITIYILISALLFAATPGEAIQQAKIKFAAGNSSDAILILEEAIQENPSNFQAKRILADICVDTGEQEYNKRNFKNAYEYFKKAVKVMPTHPIATERYWKMKSDFDVDNLRNETVQKEIKRIEANPRFADDIYVKKILEMEKRFNQRLLDMNKQIKKAAELEKEKRIFSQITGDYTPAITVVSLIVLFTAGLTLLMVFIFRQIKRRNKSKKGGKEYKRLFVDNNSRYYNELIKMQNIKELTDRIKTGDINWSMIKKTISEMNRELRLEVFSCIEAKVDSNHQPITMEQADILISLVLDGDEYLRKKVYLFLSNQSSFPGQSNNKTLPYQHTGSVVRQNDLQITDPNSAYIDDSIMEDLKIILPLSKIVDRKVFNDNHAERVGVDAYDMAGMMRLSQDECNLYYITGLIHDVGFLDIPSKILNKKSPLSEKEFNIIKTHPKRGVTLLDFSSFPQVLRDGTLYHHKKFSGEGYPEGLAGEDIPLIARVISIFDTYEALILPRPQRPAYSAKEAQRIIKKGSGRIFDPLIVKMFEKMTEENLLSREDMWEKKKIILIS